MTHPDCGERCPCYRRCAEDYRRLIGILYGKAKDDAGTAPASRKRIKNAGFVTKNGNVMDLGLSVEEIEKLTGASAREMPP